MTGLRYGLMLERCLILAAKFLRIAAIVQHVIPSSLSVGVHQLEQWFTSLACRR